MPYKSTFGIVRCRSLNQEQVKFRTLSIIGSYHSHLSQAKEVEVTEMAEVSTTMVVVWVVNLLRPWEVTCGSAISWTVRCSVAQFHACND